MIAINAYATAIRSLLISLSLDVSTNLFFYPGSSVDKPAREVLSTHDPNCKQYLAAALASPPVAYQRSMARAREIFFLRIWTSRFGSLKSPAIARNSLTGGSQHGSVGGRASSNHGSAREGVGSVPSNAEFFGDSAEALGDMSPSAGDLSPFFPALSPFVPTKSPSVPALSPNVQSMSPLLPTTSPPFGDLSPQRGDMSPAFGDSGRRVESGAGDYS